MLVANSATCPTDNTTSEGQQVLRQSQPNGPDSRSRQAFSHTSQRQRERKCGTAYSNPMGGQEPQKFTSSTPAIS
ncbi:hypothetical protein CY34DRAFT_802016 [Suillus luteus UH-Slu-Lm8-n1]|uniref:Uncharacterized protein n=1 Tax=Suillus luteus UH-Slu-Lm8-n1 TaxID=930992 RepID=A0A0D0B595_9AGAM|nr:hypothetical protein CY34DRAFT_802016 [Suillus luteus UH-Slu-Lm8-n1]